MHNNTTAKFSLGEKVLCRSNAAVGIIEDVYPDKDVYLVKEEHKDQESHMWRISQELEQYHSELPREMKDKIPDATTYIQGLLEQAYDLGYKNGVASAQSNQSEVEE